MKNILVIGSINVDYVIYTERLPKLGETLNGKDFAMNFGGKGANQAVALSKTGCNVKMLGAVGKDLSGELALNNLKSFGIDTSDVIVADAPTGAAVITVCGGDNHIILDIGANACVTPEVIAEREALFDWADFVVMQYEIPMESVLFAAHMTKKHGKKVVLNPAPVKEADPALYACVDMIIPNEFEAQLITGIEPKDEKSTEEAIRALQALGCSDAVVTLGKRGCAYTEGGEIRYAGIYNVKVVDTTAAGDSFIGGLCKSLSEGKSMTEAVVYASAVSSVTVSRPGAGVSIPTACEVEEFLKTHHIGD
ncbi:MAG: ribokinase [Clostridia bacterium]|nr:ribokinase [Clostridia bacterium]